jgi:hypothetical protein
MTLSEWRGFPFNSISFVLEPYLCFENPKLWTMTAPQPSRTEDPAAVAARRCLYQPGVYGAYTNFDNPHRIALEGIQPFEDPPPNAHVISPLQASAPGDGPSDLFETQASHYLISAEQTSYPQHPSVGSSSHSFNLWSVVIASRYQLRTRPKAQRNQYIARLLH